MTDYALRASYLLTDPEWDAFVAQTPGGHHVQTSYWSQVKAAANLCVVRLVVTDQNDIIGGAQMLMRTLAPIGAVGFVTKAPLCRTADPRLLKLVIDGLHDLARKYHLHYLVVQPPNNGENIAAQLGLLGFRRGSLELASPATVVVDLSPGLETLWARLKRQNRQNINRAERSGILIRERTKDDIGIFYALHLSTAQRQGFVPYSEPYYEEMWRRLDPPGYIQLLIAEHRGEPVSALLLVPFADTVIAKKLGWSGSFGAYGPNHLLFWEAIKWAKGKGYRYFDLEGIDPEGARAILAGEPLPEALKTSPTFFKLEFGGQVVVYPESYDYVYNPFVRWAFDKMTPDLSLGSPISKIIEQLHRH